MTVYERTSRTAVPLAEAAGRLGLTPDALRMRIRRGRAEGFKRDGRLFVYLDEPPDPGVRSSVRGERTPPEGRRTSEQARDGLAADPGGSLAVVVEFQKVELDRLLRENQRLNRRLDQQTEDARRLLEMLQREQVLRQQIQGVVERLSDRLLLPSATPGEAEPAPARGQAPGHAGTPGGGAAAPADAAAAAEPQSQAAVPPTPDEQAHDSATRQVQATDAPGAPPPSRESDAGPPREASEPETSPSPPASDPRAEALGELIKEIGQSLRELERDDGARGGPSARPRAVTRERPMAGYAAQGAAAPPAALPAEDSVALDEILSRLPLDEDRRKAARILRRLVRNRNEPRPKGR